MKKTVSIMLASILMISMFSITVLASSPNYAFSNEIRQYYYHGYVQCQPSYVENGRHAASAYIRYTGGLTGDTGRLYTGMGTGPTDGTIYSRTHYYDDTLNPFAPQTTFNHGFTWVPTGGSWPY